MLQNMDGTQIPTADMTKIKQNVISGLNYFKQNCPISVCNTNLPQGLSGKKYMGYNAYPQSYKRL